MKARFLALAALAALATACGGGGEQQAGDSVEPGATGTINNTGPQNTGTPVDTLTASDGTTAGANGSPAGVQPATGTPAPPASMSPNAPPAMTSPATEGDTAHQSP